MSARNEHKGNIRTGKILLCQYHYEEMYGDTSNTSSEAHPAEDKTAPPPVTLYWLSGEMVCHTLHYGTPYGPYDSVEDFIQRMEEGLFEDIGIPRCQTLEDGTWLEKYNLMWKGRSLECGERLSELDLPFDASLTLTLVRYSCI